MTRTKMLSQQKYHRLLFILLTICSEAAAFSSIGYKGFARFSQRGEHSSRTQKNAAHSTPVDPQVWSSGYSSKLDCLEAVEDATKIAMAGLPKVGARIDLALVSVSSLYDGPAGSAAPLVVPAIVSTASTYGAGIQHLIGCSTGGIISSIRNNGFGTGEGDTKACSGIESEATPGVSVVLAILPDVQLQTFHVLGSDVPDDFGRVPANVWKRAVGLSGFMEQQLINDEPNINSPKKPAFFLIPSPAFQNALDDLLTGIAYTFPGATTFGGIASTVSSLSRARLFRYNVNESQETSTFSEGCVGVAMVGDIEVRTMIAQGTKPIGGIYRVLTGSDCTIRAIVLDEAATEEANASMEEMYDGQDDDDNEDGESKQDKNSKYAATYAKASIPKPPLAEANFILRTLSDDDQSSMRKAILIGLERGGSMGRTPNELLRLAEGKGHRFTVFQVAAAGMKDGSVTLPLGKVNVQQGTRIRFFVRDSEFAKKEVLAILTGHKKSSLEDMLMLADETAKPFEPAMCLFLTTLDRGSKFFKGKSAFETSAISEFLPNLPSIHGFFSNGVIGKLDNTKMGDMDVMVHGSASGYVLIGSASRRPIFTVSLDKASDSTHNASDEVDGSVDDASVASNFYRRNKDERAPRAPNGELRLKRREVRSGRALTVSSVEWSVAENAATPTSTLEGFMWDKETEVDRFRERVPLSNLLSQCKLSQTDPTSSRPRDWVGPIRRRIQYGEFAVIPEFKRIDPTSGTLRRRYDVGKLAKQFVQAGFAAMVVNCDPVLFGGRLEDLKTARDASSKAALELATEDGVEVPPILASDLILYPYQLYKLRLAGADAVNLMAGALTGKDLLYLTKIAQSLQIQCFVTCTSEVQIDALLKLSKESIHGIILSNRDLEDFSFDMSGQQVLDLLKSEALKRVRAIHGDNLVVLAHGCVGLIERINKNGEPDVMIYIEELRAAGAGGAIMGSALASETSEIPAKFQVQFRSTSN